MGLLIHLVVFTANILGFFNDPFEFEGDYGPEMNATKEKVFERIIPKESLAKNLSHGEIRNQLNQEATDEEIQVYRQLLVNQAVQHDREQGPTLQELVPSELIETLVDVQHRLQSPSFTTKDLENILYFIDRYAHQKAFRFFKMAPHKLLSLDKTLQNKAISQGKPLELPILGSTQLLKGHNSLELKKELLGKLLNEETLLLPNPIEFKNSDRQFFRDLLGVDANQDDLSVFCTPAGQIIFYWLYQSLNLHLISEGENLIDEINHLKKQFGATLGNPSSRAEHFKEKLMAADAGVIFTQESDQFVLNALLKENLFHSVASQNPMDGTFIFLRSDLWYPDEEIISIDHYEGYQKGRLNMVKATFLPNHQPFLLASGHGHSTQSEDGRLQIRLIMEKFHQLSKTNPGLQLLIGMDANTKTKEDVKLFRELLDDLGLVATDVGPTTVKKRMATVQTEKAGRRAIDEEDYLITLKSGHGGRFSFSSPTVGFREHKADTTISLPNLENPSDHYPVGAILK